MFWIFNELLYRPLFNATVFLYNFLPGNDFGLAIIILTIIIRVILFPLSIKAIKSQKELAKVNPKLKDLKEKYKNDQAGYSKATMDLYKEHGINPIAGCLPLLIQIPVLIALYRAFIAGFRVTDLSTLLYGFIANPGVLNKSFLGILDITAKNHWLAIVAGLFQFVQSKMAAPMAGGDGSDKGMSAINNQMLYFFPFMIIIIGWNLPSGIVLYLITTTIFSILEQSYTKKFK